MSKMFHRSKKSFKLGWDKFFSTFPKMEKRDNPLTDGIKKIFQVNTIQSVYNIRDGKSRITEYDALRIEKLFTSFNITDIWDEPQETD